MGSLRPEWIAGLRSDPGAFQYVGHEIGVPRERMGWKQVRHHAPGRSGRPPGDPEARFSGPATGATGMRVSVFYEFYDGLPCYSKWITVASE